MFFPTVAYQLDAATWRIPVHGWIYRPSELSQLRRATMHLIKRLLRFKMTRLEPSATLFRQRMGSFLADNERNQKLQIELAGRLYSLRKSRPNGHFQSNLDIPRAHLPQITGNHWLGFRALTRPGDDRSFIGRTLLLPPQGLSVISDIDDTIKITHVLDRREMLHNTFLADFNCVSGMAQVYQRWADTRGAAFHYVSGSPWHLFPFLTEFLAAQGFPAGTFHLRDFRLMFRDLPRTLRSSASVKSRHIKHLLQTFPGRRFLLVGDSGESDPEIYAAAARRFPAQIQQIFIRNVTREPSNSARMAAVFGDFSPDFCRIFDDSGEISG